MGYIDLLQQLIAFDTTNNPAQGIRPNRDCPEFLQEYLSELEITAEIIDQEGYYSVLGRIGFGRPVTLFMAHFDVVPCGLGWKTDPFELMIRKGLGFGRGTADDKGNCTALLLVAQAIREKSVPGTVAFAMTGDEEIGGLNGALAVRNRLEKLDLFPDYLITADGVGMRIVTRRRNTCGFTISVPKHAHQCQGESEQHQFTTEFFGRESRHSAYFLPGVDRHALLAASSFLNQHPDLLVSQVSGSFVKSNVVPDNVELHTINPKNLHQTSSKVECDVNLTRVLRILLPLSRIHFTAYPSDYGITLCPNLLREMDGRWEVYIDARAMTTDIESEEKAIHTVLCEKLAETKYQLQIHMGRAFMNTPTTSRLVTIAQKITKELRLDPQPIELGGASDTRHFTDRPIEAIDFGPLGYAIHGPNENVVLESIHRTAVFYTHLIQALHTRSTS